MLLGRDPEDLTAPAIVFDVDGKRICEGVEHVVRGAYRSADGARRAARNRQAAAKDAAKAQASNDYMAVSDFEAALADLPNLAPAAPVAPAKVVGARFGGSVRDRAPDTTPEPPRVPEEFLRNMDRALAGKTGAGG